MKSKKKKQQFWGGRLDESPEILNLAYCAGRDVAVRPMADEVLVPYDCWQNKAHVLMLCRQGIIKSSAAKRILRALDQYEVLVAAGKRRLDSRKEDVHTNIEHYVAETESPEISGVMHTGRSRNDQSATVCRMFLRSRVLSYTAAVMGLISELLEFSAKNTTVVVGGYTHYQPACITTIGHWFSSHAEALLRDVERLLDCYERINVSPLGAAASFGTGWPIDRELSAKLLGFDSVQANTLDCVTNRWEMEADVAAQICFAMSHLSILAQDIVVLSSVHVGVLHIADRYVTGSSIMPQKRNPDFCEVTRAKAALVEHLMATIFSIARGSLSGYNRDSQWTKYIIMDLLDEVKDAPTIFKGVFETMRVNETRAKELAMSNFINAVDVADALAIETGWPFRKAYELVSVAVKLCNDKGYIDLDVIKQLCAKEGVKELKLKVGTPLEIVENKTHTGGPAPKAVKKQIVTMKSLLSKSDKRLKKLIDNLDEARETLNKMSKALS